ncbi:hypothetical protein Tco_0780059 [Tanacetum coccineum]
MSSITDIKSVLTQKGLDIFCQSFHIPNDVHPQLPSPNQTIHEMPTGKIGVYTRFFEFANFQLPLSTFLVNVLRHYRINLSQLSVIAVAKVSYFEILCRVHGIEPTVGLFRCFYVNSKNKGWMSFSKRPDSDAEEARLLDSTIRRVVPLLPVASARAKSELEASVEILFDEGDGSSHPPKKLRGDYKTSGEAATSGKSPSVLKELLASSMLNVEAGVAAVATLPMVTSLVSATPDTNAAKAGIDSFVRSVTPPPVMTEAVITTNVARIPSAPAPETGTKVITLVHASMFHDSDSAGTMKPDAAGSSHFPGKWNVSNDTLLDDHDVSQEFIDHLAPPVLFAQIHEMDYLHLFTEFNVGTARQACLNAKVRMRTKYCLSKRRRLESECEKQADLLKARDAEVESLKAQLLLKETEAAEAAKIDALKQRNATLEDEKDSLDGKVVELQSLVSARDLELEGLNADVSSLRSQKDGLVDQVHALETSCSSLRDQVSRYEQLIEEIEEFQDAQMNAVNENVAKLDADLLEMACQLEENFYPHLLTTISGMRWLLTHGMKLFLVKCLNSSDYLMALGAAISRAIKQGMQSGLAAGIDHGKEGKSLIDVAAYNPDAEADFNSALQKLRGVDFPLLTELKSHKDASVEDVINLLLLEGPLVDAPRMSNLQPDVEQLRVPIHRSKDQVVLGETSLSFTLSVSHSRIKRIRENVAAQQLALIGVWNHLSEPLSVQNLTGAASMSTTFASTSSIPPITIEDYEIADADGQEGGQESV